MNLKITAIKDGGNVKEERIVLKASGDCDTGHYILIDSTYSETGRTSAKSRPAFIFPSVKVAKGEYVRVYTKSGTYHTSPAKYDADGNLLASLNHNFYWGMRGVMWNIAGEYAMLIKVAAKNSLRVPADPTEIDTKTA